MPDDGVTRGDLEAMRTEFTKELGNTKLEVERLRSDMTAQLADLRTTMVAELGGLRKEVAVVTVTMTHLQHDMGRLNTAMERLQQSVEDSRKTTARQMWTMISVVTATIVIGMVQLAFFPTP